MLRRSLVLSLAVLAITVSCSDDDDDSPTDPGGSALEGFVRSLIYAGEGVPGIAVASGTVSDVTGTDGSFALAGVEAPYDIVAVVPDVPDGQLFLTGYDGGTDSPPVLGGVQASWNNPRFGLVEREDVTGGTGGTAGTGRGYANDGAEIEGTVSNGDAGGEVIEVSVGDGSRGSSFGIFSPGTGTYAGIQVVWSRAATHTVDLAALQLDAGGAFRFGRTDDIELPRNTSSNVINVALTPVAGGTGEIPVSATPPAGTSFDDVTWTSYVVTNGLVVRAEVLESDTGTLRVPLINGASFYVSVTGSYSSVPVNRGGTSMFFVATFTGAEVNTPIDVDAPEGAELTTPADGSTDVALDPDFELTPATDTLRQLLLVTGAEPYGSAVQLWVILASGDATTMSLPVSDAIGARLYPETGYSWSVLSLLEGPAATPSNAIRLLRVADEPMVDVGLATGQDLVMVQSPGLAFETTTE